MRLPNGFGQISKIKNRKLRNPYRAMITVGFKPDGHPKQEMLKPKAYFKTYHEAYEALAEYHRKNDKYNANKTLGELYEMWYSEHSQGISASRRRGIESAWKYLEPIADEFIQNIRTVVLKVFLDNLPTTPGMKKQAKILLNGIYNYAVQYEYVSVNVIPNITLADKAEEREYHIPYTESEMNILWEHQDEQLVQIILVQCYGGWRPKEVLDLKLENISLEEQYMRGGSKTEAGKNRIVPIHPKIKEIVEKNYRISETLGSEYLFSFKKTGNPIRYQTERDRYVKFVKKYNFDEKHRMHDGRVQFVTMCKEAGVDEYAIKRMVGHAIKDITEKVYTKRDLEWLRSEIQKIK